MNTFLVANASVIQESTNGYDLESALQLFERGEYVEAEAALGSLWAGPGIRPVLDGYSVQQQAEILLLTGMLSGGLGSAQQASTIGENGRDLLSEAARLFAEIGAQDRWAEARCALAVSYWRAGALEECHIIAAEALQQTPINAFVAKLKLHICLALCAWSSNNHQDTLTLLRQAAPLLQVAGNPLLQGKFYQLKGTALRGLAEGDTKAEASLLAEALNNYKKAASSYRRANSPTFAATCAINAGNVFLQLGQFRQAHYHLDAALTYYTKVGEKGYEASARDSKALVYLAEGNLTKAEREAIASVRLRQAGAEWSMLAESLRTLARVFIRRGLVAKAQQALSDAHAAAMSAGDSVGAGVSLLQWLEELSEHTPLSQARELYRSTVELLVASGNVALHRRLHEVSLQFVPASEEAENETTEAPIDWDNFSLYPALREVEANYLKAALRAAQGRVGRAAQLLGVTHQALSFALQHRFPEIAAQEKKPRRPRTVRPKAAPLAA